MVSGHATGQAWWALGHNTPVCTPWPYGRNEVTIWLTAKTAIYMKKEPQEPSREALRLAFTLCVRHFRLKAGLAQEQLAAKAGIDRAYMGGLERGRHIPSIVTAYRIQRALEISCAEWCETFHRKLRTAEQAKE